MILSKLSPLQNVLSTLPPFAQDFAKLLAAMSDAEKMRMQAVLAEPHKVQREMVELSEDYETMKAVTEAMVERFEHPELRLH